MRLGLLCLHTFVLVALLFTTSVGAASPNAMEACYTIWDEGIGQKLRLGMKKSEVDKVLKKCFSQTDMEHDLYCQYYAMEKEEWVLCIFDRTDALVGMKADFSGYRLAGFCNKLGTPRNINKKQELAFGAAYDEAAEPVKIYIEEGMNKTYMMIATNAVVGLADRNFYSFGKPLDIGSFSTEQADFEGNQIRKKQQADDKSNGLSRYVVATRALEDKLKEEEVLRKQGKLNEETKKRLDKEKQMLEQAELEVKQFYLSTWK